MANLPRVYEEEVARYVEESLTGLGLDTEDLILGLVRVVRAMAEEFPDPAQVVDEVVEVLTSD